MKAVNILQIMVVTALAMSLLLTGCPQETVTVDDVVIVEDPEEHLEEAEGREAPDFTVPLAHGGEASLADYEGKILVLDFWATWCTSCVRELPEYQELYDEWDQEQVEYLGMSLDSDMEIIEAFLERRDDLTLPMALAPEETVEAYLGARRTLPSSRVIDANGIIRYEFMGPVTERIRQAVETLLTETGAVADEVD